MTEVEVKEEDLKKESSEEVKIAETKVEEKGKKLELSLEGMLKSGLHFGHKKARWNPKMKNYIFILEDQENIERKDE